MASQTDTVTAVVESIDHDTREVTLTDHMGTAFTFIAGDNVRNLKQVSVGDVLVVEHMETVLVEVYAGDGLGADQMEMMTTAKAEEGEMPGISLLLLSLNHWQSRLKRRRRNSKNRAGRHCPSSIDLLLGVPIGQCVSQLSESFSWSSQRALS